MLVWFYLGWRYVSKVLFGVKILLLLEGVGGYRFILTGEIIVILVIHEWKNCFYWGGSKDSSIITG